MDTNNNFTHTNNIANQNNIQHNNIHNNLLLIYTLKYNKCQLKRRKAGYAPDLGVAIKGS